MGEFISPFKGSNSFYALLQAFKALIDAVAFEEVLFQDGVCPLSEEYALGGFYPITDGKNHVKVVEFHHSYNTAAALILNYRKFCDSCHALQFFSQGVVDVLSDGIF